MKDLIGMIIFFLLGVAIIFLFLYWAKDNFKTLNPRKLIKRMDKCTTICSDKDIARIAIAGTGLTIGLIFALTFGIGLIYEYVILAH